jgi:hypothetical protein
MNMAAKKKPRKKLFFHWENKAALTDAQAELIKAKSKRRAKRHFAGGKIRHRVVTVTQDSITFAFKRHTNRVTIRWRIATV